MKKIFSEFILGDMCACYVQDEETGSVELVLLPADMAYEVAYREKPYPDSLVQVKLSGDTYAGGRARPCFHSDWKGRKRRMRAAGRRSAQRWRMAGVTVTAIILYGNRERRACSPIRSLKMFLRRRRNWKCFPAFP